MKKLLSFLLMLLFCAVSMAQTVTLTFTGRDTNNQYVQLNRVVIENATQGWQETLVYPDTVLKMTKTGIEDYEAANGFALQQNNPNPFDVITYATLSTVETGDVMLGLIDIHGRLVETLRATSLQPGIHHFRIHVANPGTYLLTARQNTKTSSIKMVNNGKGAENKIEYQETQENQNLASLPVYNAKGETNNAFNEGDEMVFTGYATVDSTEYQSQTIRQKQTESENFILVFAIEPPVVTLPVVLTDSVRNISDMTAICGGNVTSDGGGTITERGICYGTKSNPTVDDAKVTAAGTTGTFTCTLTNLTAGTTYYARAYAMNSAGTAYGNEVSFSTSVTMPTVTTAEVINITQTTATCGGDVTSDGGAVITERGICYGSKSNPTVADNNIVASGTTGTFTCELSNLLAGTTYYVRAYAKNSQGTAYGNPVNFTTEAVGENNTCPDIPTVTDHEGNVYHTVQIGNQCWMKENMRCTTSPSTGTTILEKSPGGVSYSGKKAYYVNGSANNTATYGLLYNWYAAMDTFNTKFGETSTSDDYEACPLVTFSGNRRGICPEGWHVPSKEDFKTLTDFVSSHEEYVNCDTNICIAPALASKEGWLSSPYEGAIGNSPENNNATGFSAIAAGFYSYYGFEALGYLNYLCTTTQEDNIYVCMFELNKSYSFVNMVSDTKCNGISVRCLKD